MTERIKELILRLEKEHSLTEAEYAELITGQDPGKPRKYGKRFSATRSIPAV